MGRLWPNPDNPTEPQWLDEDIQAVLEWQREQRLICDGCGLPRDETWDPDMENGYTAKAWTCHACAARERKEKAMGSELSSAISVVPERI